MATRTSSYLQRVFSNVSATYELINHVLTLGFDILWRRRAARIAARAQAGCWADMCSGTGEMAAYLARLATPETQVLAVDQSLPMLGEVNGKAMRHPIACLSSDVRALPLPDATLDLVTMSFATRNVNLNRAILIETFAEYRRVLKPGARFVSVETSQPPLSFIRAWFHNYVKLCVRPIGTRISGSRIAYTYLSKTIPRFYPAEELAEIMREAGFDHVTFKRLLFGVAAIHVATRLE